MSNQKEQQENELKHLRNNMESIERCINTGTTDENGDLVISDEQFILIKLLLQDG